MSLLARLKTMSDEEIQDWLRKVNEKVDPKGLAVALLGVDDEIKNCVFRNMSEKAVEALKVEMERFRRMDAKEIVIHMHGNILDKLI
jgi:flagellar motor switch protein FliG